MQQQQQQQQQQHNGNDEPDHSAAWMLSSVGQTLDDDASSMLFIRSLLNRLDALTNENTELKDNLEKERESLAKLQRECAQLTAQIYMENFNRSIQEFNDELIHIAYKRALQDSEIGIVVIKLPTNELVFANKAFEEAFGYTQQELASQPEIWHHRINLPPSSLLPPVAATITTPSGEEVIHYSSPEDDAVAKSCKTVFRMCELGATSARFTAPFRTKRGDVLLWTHLWSLIMHPVTNAPSALIIHGVPAPSMLQQALLVNPPPPPPSSSSSSSSVVAGPAGAESGGVVGVGSSSAAAAASASASASEYTTITTATTSTTTVAYESSMKLKEPPEAFVQRNQSTF